MSDESTNYRTKLGQKQTTFTTFGSRFGPGKVHRYYYDVELKEWRVWCQSRDKMNPYGTRTDRDLELTCKKCITRRR